MIASDDELTVQREVEWPKEHAPDRATEAMATEVLREAAPRGNREVQAQKARATTQASRVRDEDARRAGPRPSARNIGRLQLAGALALGAVLASGVSLLAARRSAPSPAHAPVASTTALARASEPAARATTVEPPAPVGAAHPGDAEAASEWTPSTAAAALARNEYDIALRAYRALAELHPSISVYRVISDVLARKLVHHCGEGAACRAQ